jgi:hypothetical protein
VFWLYCCFFVAFLLFGGL